MKWQVGACGIYSLALMTPVVAAASDASDPTLVFGPATVRVAPATCTVSSLVGDEMVRILTVELRSDGVDAVSFADSGASSEPSGDLATVAVAIDPCDANTSDVVVTVEDRVTAKRISRRLSLHDLPEAARPRALALAIAELFRASWTELTIADRPPGTVEPPMPIREGVARRIGTSHAAPAAPSASAAPSAPMASTGSMESERPVFTDDRIPRPSFVAAWRDYPAGPASMFGGRAGAALPVLAPWLLCQFDLGLVFGAARDPLGNVNVGLGSSGAALLFASPRDAVVSAAVGTRLELGVAWATGNPLLASTSSYSGTGFVAGASILGAMRIRLTHDWSLALELEAGTTATRFSAQADGRQVVGVEGTMFGVALGIARSLTASPRL
jgi:hypothetical protein